MNVYEAAAPPLPLERHDITAHGAKGRLVLADAGRDRHVIAGFRGRAGQVQAVRDEIPVFGDEKEEPAAGATNARRRCWAREGLGG